MKIETTNISQKDVTAFIFSDTYLLLTITLTKQSGSQKVAITTRYLQPHVKKYQGPSLRVGEKKTEKKIRCVRTITFSAVFPSVPFLFLTSSFFVFRVTGPHIDKVLCTFPLQRFFEFSLQNSWNEPQIREQMSGPNLHVFTLKSLALKKCFFHFLWVKKNFFF